jgi:hypothetical protein
MKFDLLTGQPLVGVTLAPKTAVDRRVLMLDSEDTLQPMLKKNDHPIEYHTDRLRYVKGLACTHENCGADWNTRENHPALRFVVPGGEASYPNNGRYLHCTVCVGPIVRASTLFPHLYTKARAKHLDAYSCTKLHDRDFTAVRCGGRSVVTDLSFQQGARQVATNQPDLKSGFEALLIRTCGLDVAAEALGREDFPLEVFKVVPVTHELWPTARWHSQTMTATDTAGIRGHARRQRREAEKAIEAEVQAFRNELKARQRA